MSSTQLDCRLVNRVLGGPRYALACATSLSTHPPGATLPALKVEARLLQQTPATLRKVLAPKLAAALRCMGNAHSLEAPTFAVLFSSVSAIAGFTGQANYAAANSALDALAADHAGRGVPAVAVQWGAWSSVGV